MAGKQLKRIVESDSSDVDEVQPQIDKDPERPPLGEDSSSEDDAKPLAQKIPSHNGNARPLNKKPRLSDAKQTKAGSSDQSSHYRRLGISSSSSQASSSDTSEQEDYSSDDEKPLAKVVKAKPKKQVASKINRGDASNGSRKAVKKEQNGASAGSSSRGEGSKNKKKAVKKEEEEDDMPLAVKVKKAKQNGHAKPETSRASGKVKEEDADDGGGDDDDEDEDEEHRWWEKQAQGDGTVKWQSLEHNGVLFPPAYEPLPKDVKMKYDGRAVDLPPESEEVANFFGAMMETSHAQKPVFVKNFFEDWQKVLKEHPPRNGIVIEEFQRCDFRPFLIHAEAERDRKKAMSRDEKKAIKENRDSFEAKYKTCKLDGREEKVGNFRIEPPGLFRGRGDHPKTGRLKKRVTAEQITLNISKDAKVPDPPAGHHWKEVRHDNTVTWLAYWQENINQAHKYVFLAAGSSIKGQSDMSKFEKARQLKDHIEVIRKDYNVQLRDKVTEIRQRATAMYLIDIFALRAGNEKGDDEADTVGCCSLRYEHVMLSPPNTVTFDFLGKDSIRYRNEVQVDPQVFKNLKIFKREPKTVGDMIFDRLTPSKLNVHLQHYMKGLSAKVFRTYNASFTFQRELDKITPKNATVHEKILAYNRANRIVAILCNHQRSVSTTHESSMGKLADKLRAVKYQRRKLRDTLKTVDKKVWKSKGLDQDESDMDEDWVVSHEKELKEKEIERAKSKFEKDNEKIKLDIQAYKRSKTEEGGKPELLDKSVLNDRISKINEKYKGLSAERKSRSVESNLGADKILEKLLAVDKRVEAQRVLMTDREEGKETSLGTSKINYLDPRITTTWCKKHGVPLEKMFSKTLREKFTWAMEVDESWKF